ncbi:hypothetical protein B0H14DRAFT_3129732 [Mycena olivaceomarginata]|nr:hypothetical protein B0H14DRAFT_3129732 [Mycena olivaceomarginata]
MEGGHDPDAFEKRQTGVSVPPDVKSWWVATGRSSFAHGTKFDPPLVLTTPSPTPPKSTRNSGPSAGPGVSVTGLNDISTFTSELMITSLTPLSSDAVSSTATPSSAQISAASNKKTAHIIAGVVVPLVLIFIGVAAFINPRVWAGTGRKSNLHRMLLPVSQKAFVRDRRMAPSPDKALMELERVMTHYGQLSEPIAQYSQPRCREPSR